MAGCAAGEQLRDLVSELGDLGIELLRLRRQRGHRVGLVLARLLVRAHLRVAPALVLGLLRGLLHELDDHVLDHLLHLVEGAAGASLAAVIS